MIVNYNSRVITDKKIAHITTDLPTNQRWQFKADSHQFEFQFLCQNLIIWTYLYAVLLLPYVPTYMQSY